MGSARIDRVVMAAAGAGRAWHCHRDRHRLQRRRRLIARKLRRGDAQTPPADRRRSTHADPAGSNADPLPHAAGAGAVRIKPGGVKSSDFSAEKRARRWYEVVARATGLVFHSEWWDGAHHG